MKNPRENESWAVIMSVIYVLKSEEQENDLIFLQARFLSIIIACQAAQLSLQTLILHNLLAYATYMFLRIKLI